MNRGFNERPFKRKELLKKDRITVLMRDGLVCHDCGCGLHLTEFRNISIENGTFHHIIPQVYGGLNNATNCCILCNPCHKYIHSSYEIQEKYLTHYENFLSGEALPYVKKS